MSLLKTMKGVFQNQVLGQNVPIAITMALTYRCNLRCRYCQIWKAADRELSTRQVFAAIDELYEAGMCRLGLTGGEPLLRDDFGQIVDHARTKNLFVSVFTNGTLVPDHLETLRKLDVVLISFDGPKEVHDAMRGKGAHDAALNAIKLLSSSGIKVWTNTVVTSRNVGVIDYVLDVARDNGGHAAFQPIFEHSYSVNLERVEKLQADRQQYEALMKKLIAEKEAGAPLLNSMRSLKILENPSWDDNPRKCLAAACYGAVAPDGTVSPCPILLQREGLPDGQRVGFARAFQRTTKPPVCHGCFCFATIESDLLFSLDPSSVTNTVKYLLGERWRVLTRKRQAPATPRFSAAAVKEIPPPKA